MHIKICGLTNLEDALAAVEAGADHLGFNFYPHTPRCITPAVCARIVAFIRRHSASTKCVGVFVNESSASVAAILDLCGLHLAQLHGDESPEQVVLLRGRAFKALRGITSDAHLAAFARASCGAPALLFDAHHAALYGGTGQTADWSAARAVAAQFPMLLAGGLTPQNVAEAVAQVRPWGVDVASGVESAPGRKDHGKIRALVEAALSARVDWRSSRVETP